MEGDWKETLLQGYSFKLKGLKEEAEKDYTQIIQDLGGNVSDTGDCVLSDLKYFKQCKGSLKSDLFCLHFIQDAIIAKKPPNILKYKYHCTSEKSKNAIENHSIHSIPNVRPHTGKHSTSSSRQTSELMLNPYRRKAAVEREDNCVLEEFQNRNQCHPDLQRKSNQSKRKVASHSSENRCALEEPRDQNQHRPNFQRNIIYRKRRISPERVCWLSAKVSEEKACRKKRCTFEPDLHRKHCPAQPEISIDEEKIIIKYLVKFDLIKDAKERRTYRDMLKKGYLTHRDPKTLRDHFKTQILCEIDEYDLPSEIIEEFRKA